MNSLNNNKWLFILYGVPNVTEAFLFDVGIVCHGIKIFKVEELLHFLGV